MSHRLRQFIGSPSPAKPSADNDKSQNYQNKTFTRERLMTVICPICKSSAQEPPRTSDATAIHCPTHGEFKVADTVLGKANHTREQWEAALDKAEQRAEPDAWPLIITDDFY